jgi:hypothetical protein
MVSLADIKFVEFQPIVTNLRAETFKLSKNSLKVNLIDRPHMVVRSR